MPGFMLGRMSTTEEIEAAIRSLPDEEFWSFTDRVIAMRERAWDRRIKEDATSGKLDFLFAEADSERKAEALREWPQGE